MDLMHETKLILARNEGHKGKHMGFPFIIVGDSQYVARYFCRSSHRDRSLWADRAGNRAGVGGA